MAQGTTRDRRAYKDDEVLDFGNLHSSMLSDWELVPANHDSQANRNNFVKKIRVSKKNGSDETALATFDTGSTHDWVSWTLVSSYLNATVKHLPHTQAAISIDFNGRIVEAIGIVSLIWYIPSDSHKVYRGWFYVSQQEHFDVIIGSKTIARENILVWNLGTLWPNKKKLMPIRDDGQPKLRINNLFSYRSRKRAYEAEKQREEELDEAKHLARRQEARLRRDRYDAEVASQSIQQQEQQISPTTIQPSQQRADNSFQTSQYFDAESQDLSVRAGKLAERPSDLGQSSQQAPFQLPRDQSTSDHDSQASTSHPPRPQQPDRRVHTQRPEVHGSSMHQQPSQTGSSLHNEDFPRVPSEPISNTVPDGHVTKEDPRLVPA